MTSRVREAWCSCNHPIAAHGTYSRTRTTACGIGQCECPRPRNENLICLIQAWAIIAFGVMCLLVFMAVFS